MNRTKTIKITIFLISILVLGIGLKLQIVQTRGDSLNKWVLIPLSISLSLILISLSLFTRVFKSVLWFVVALLETSGMLLLIDAGNLIHYQHYISPEQLLEGPYLGIFIFLIIQSVVVYWGIRPYFLKLKRWLTSNFTNWQILILSGLFLFSGVAVSRNYFYYLWEIVLNGYLQFLSILTLLLVFLNLPTSMWTKSQRLLNNIFSKEKKIKLGFLFIDPIVSLFALWVFITTLTLNLLSYQHHPHIPDETAYWIQAHYFSKGLLYLPNPPVPEAFQLEMMLSTEKGWFSIFPFGWPLMLSIGFLIGLPGLVNPFLSALNILLGYSIIKRLYSVTIARIAIFLLTISPWFIFMGMNFMSHMFTLTCAILATLGVLNLREQKTILWAVWTGLFLGILVWTRQMDALAMAFIIGLWSLPVKGRSFRFSPTLILGFTTIIVGSALLFYHKLLMNDYFYSPLVAYFDRKYGPGIYSLGFGPNKGVHWPLDPFPGHGLRDVVVNSMLNLFSINTDLFGWPFGSILFIGFFLLKGKLQKKDWQLLFFVAVIIGLYSLFWYNGGPDFGARYWFLIIIPCVILTARGLTTLTNLINRDSPKDYSLSPTLLPILSLALLTLFIYIPWRSIDKYYHFRGMRPDIKRFIHNDQFNNSIVLIQGPPHPDYVSAAIYNPFDFFSSKPIFARDINSIVRNRLFSVYQDRKFWLVEGPSITGNGYKVIKGPMSAMKLKGILENEASFIAP